MNTRSLVLALLAACSLDAGAKPEIVGADDDQDRPAFNTAEDRDATLRERVLDAAERRGIPVLFPLLDSEDRAAVRFSDVWGGFDQALLDASRRYGTASILVGRVRAEDPTGNRWNYHFGNQQFNWTGTPEVALERLADSLAEQFSYSGNASAEQVTLTVSDVDSLMAYAAVRRVLAGLSMVENYRIDTVEGSDIRYRIDVQGGTGRLASALEFSSVLEPSDSPTAGNYSGNDPANRNLDYRYRRQSPAPAAPMAAPDVEAQQDVQ